jgi:hypothetical protein
MSGKGSKALIVVAMLLAVAPMAQAQGNWRPGDFGAFRVRLGLFEPDGDSSYWSNKGEVWTSRASDFEDLSFGLDYRWNLTQRSGLIFGTSSYEGNSNQAYRDWTDDDGRDIVHTTRLELSDLTVAWVARFRRSQPLQLYAGVGGGVLWWRLEEEGSFIDFTQLSPTIVHEQYREDGTTFEAFLLAGVEVPLGSSLSFFGEGRWRHADDTLSYAYYGIGDRLDLSGVEYTAGLSWNF